MTQRPYQPVDIYQVTREANRLRAEYFRDLATRLVQRARGTVHAAPRRRGTA